MQENLKFTVLKMPFFILEKMSKIIIISTLNFKNVRKNDLLDFFLAQSLKFMINISIVLISASFLFNIFQSFKSCVVSAVKNHVAHQHLSLKHAFAQTLI